MPLEDLCNKFSHMRFEPSGFTNNRQIPIAKSLMDYIFRYLSMRFLDLSQLKPEVADNLGVQVKAAGPATDTSQADMFEEPAHPLVGVDSGRFSGRTPARRSRRCCSSGWALVQRIPESGGRTTVL